MLVLLGDLSVLRLSVLCLKLQGGALRWTNRRCGVSPSITVNAPLTGKVSDDIK